MNPSYHIADDNVLLVHGRKVVVLIDEETGTRQAFYQSNGRHGGSAKGQWVPFFGFDFVAALGGTYFIKHADGKTFEPESELGRMSTWLGQQAIEARFAPELPVWWKCQSLHERLSLINELVRLNAYLTAMGVPERTDEPRLAEPKAARIRRWIRESFSNHETKPGPYAL